MERNVTVLGREVTIAGRDSDTGLAQLPVSIAEPAIDCAGALLADDACVIDGGANLGLTAIGFALVAPRGRVYAIEASPSTFEYLAKNVERSGVANVECLHVALGDVEGTVELFDNEWFSAGSFVKQDTLASSLHTGSTTVRCETIDHLVDRLGIERLDWLKLDIEGHEIPALDGARTTLERFRPTAFIEMNFFTITSFASMLPVQFLGEVMARFPFVYDFSYGQGLFPVADEHDVYQTAQRQFVAGRPSDLICRFEPLSEDAQDELRRVAHERAAAPAAEPVAEPVVAPPEEHDDAELRHEIAELRHEIAMLRSSTSWKVTGPMRWASERARGLLEQRRSGQ